MTDHRCPPSGQRTLRADWVVRDLAAEYEPDQPVHWVRVLRRVRDDLRHMAEHRLCPDCGFPVDMSKPYPREGT